MSSGSPTVTPNPSVEARPNGGPPGPVWRYAVHFRQPGLASHRRPRLTSNVRRHRATLLALVPMETAEFAEFFEVAANSYAADNIANGRWNASDAFNLAREESKRLLPEGEKTAENYLFVLRDNGQQADVGYLWYGTMTRAQRRSPSSTRSTSTRSTAEKVMVAKPCMRSRPRR